MAADADPEVEVGERESVFPIDFEFKDIRLTVKLARPRPWKPSPGKREILKGVSGIVRSGESLAILGPSGSGKTTLLDVLADRRKSSSFSGERFINGDPNMANYRHLAAYVPQEDALFPRLTVEESLLYSARLRLESDMPDKEKKAIVARVIELLGLQSCRKGLVGGRGVRGISGGERKRTAIGMELVTTPSMLFLDEPTSGLDASSALTIAHIVRALSSKGRTVVLTIHQPSAAILNCFTNVLFLSAGEVIYYGPPTKLVAYMQSVGYELPDGANPADSMLELISDKSRDNGALVQAAAQHRHKDARPGYVKQTAILTYRNLLLSLRSPEIFIGRVFLLGVNALLLSSVFWMDGHDDTGAAARKILGFIVFTIALSMFTSFQALPIFLDEKDIYRRERGSGYYSLGCDVAERSQILLTAHSAYAMALLLVQLPLLALLAILYTGISYYLVGLTPGADNFFFFVFLMFATLFAAQSFVLFISAVVPNNGAGQGLGAAVFSYFFLFAGYFIPARDIPSYWIWVYWISLFRYPLEAGAQNQFMDPSVGPYNVCQGAYAATSTDGAQCSLKGGALMDWLGVRHNIDKWVLLVILCGFAFLYRLLFFLILKFFVTSKQR